MFVRLPNVAHNLPLGSRLIRFRNLGSLGGWTLGSTNVEGGLHSPFLVKPNLTRSPKIISCYVHSHRNLYWFGGITSAYGQRCSRASSNLWASSTDLFGSKTRQLLETYSRSEQTKPFGDHQDFPPTRGVGYLNRFQGHLLPYTYTRTIQEMPEISHPRSGIPVQGPAFRFVHSTLGVHRDPKGGESDGHTQGFKKPLVPRRLVGESQIPPDLSPTYTGSSK